MDIEGFREYCLSLPGVSEGTPFEKFSRGKFTILVFYDWISVQLGQDVPDDKVRELVSNSYRLVAQKYR